MGSAAEILTHLQADGLTLHAKGDRLLAEPRGLITDEHRHLIRDHKPELLAHLQAANEEPALAKSDATRVRAWLASIGETDEQTTNEVLQMCAADAAALAYYLGRASTAER